MAIVVVYVLISPDFHHYIMLGVLCAGPSLLFIEL